MGRSSGGGGRGGGGTQNLKNLVSSAVREISVPDTSGMTERAANRANSQARGAAIIRVSNRLTDDQAVNIARRINVSRGREKDNRLFSNYVNESGNQRARTVSFARGQVERYLEATVPRF